MVGRSLPRRPEMALISSQTGLTRCDSLGLARIWTAANWTPLGADEGDAGLGCCRWGERPREPGVGLEPPTPRFWFRQNFNFQFSIGDWLLVIGYRQFEI